jgi:adenylate kinase
VGDGVYCRDFILKHLELGIVMKLIMLGSPGVGKGTQAQLLAAEYDAPQISTGDILRAAIKTRSPLGLAAEQYVSRGELVPDTIMLRLIEEKLYGENPVSNFILDGFPRTVPQAEGLELLFNKYGTRLNAVLLLEADNALITRRLSARRTCRNCQVVYNLFSNPPEVENRCDHCGGELFQRVDDQPETIRKRLKIYAEQTKPLVSLYRAKGLLQTVQAIGSPQEVHTKLIQILEE